MLHRRVEKALYLGEGDDFVEFAGDLGPRHAKDGAVEEDVFPSAEFGMKPRADFQQARDAAKDFDPSGAWLGDAREDFQQRGLARAVAADDADHIALGDVERHLAQGPEILCRIPGVAPPAAQKGPCPVCECVAQGVVPGLVGEFVALAEVFDGDDGVGHGQMMSAKLRSVRRKYQMPVTSRMKVIPSPMSRLGA